MTDIEPRIQRAALKREAIAERLAAADKELHKLIREAFAAGLTGPAIAAAAGISRERAYQIRDGRR